MSDIENEGGGKRVYVEVPARVWQRIREAAAREGRPVKAVVTNALRVYLAGGGARSRDAETERVVESAGSRAESLRALVNQVVPGAVKTARQMAAKRESRRGDEGGSQVPPEDGEF